MSWMSILSEVYDHLMSGNEEDRKELLPLSTVELQADITVYVSGLGEYAKAEVVPKDRKKTVIIASDASENRTRDAAWKPHPLHDKLQYVAGDYVAYGGSDTNISYTSYMEQLRAWVEDASPPYLAAILQYLEKGTLIRDLVSDGVLHVDESGKLLKRWDRNEGESPDIFKTVAGDQSGAFVRFAVIPSPGRDPIRLWEDMTVIESFNKWDQSRNLNVGLDYVTGEIKPLGSTHGKYIRFPGDGAKLISSNDTVNYTFRGRFATADEAVTIGWDTTTKAHNALRWLIRQQGKRIGSRVFLAFGSNASELPDVLANSYDAVNLRNESGIENPDISWMLLDEPECINGYEMEGSEVSVPEYSSQYLFAQQFNDALMGYRSRLRQDANIVIMSLDAATPGRMAITYYKNFPQPEIDKLFRSLSSWHVRASWRNAWYEKNDKKWNWSICAPSLRDIAQAAFGIDRDGKLEVNENLESATVQRLLPCVIDEDYLLPTDIVRALTAKACHPQGYTDFNRDRVLRIACSMIRYYRNQRYKEEWSVDVDCESRDVTYLLGRYFAVLDEIESRALWLQRQSRATGVSAYFAKFADHPSVALEQIQKSLVVYKRSLGSRGNDLYAKAGEIAALITPEELHKARNLDGRFLLGFDAQKHEIFSKRMRGNVDKSTNEDQEETTYE